MRWGECVGQARSQPHCGDALRVLKRGHCSVLIRTYSKQQANSNSSQILSSLASRQDWLVKTHGSTPGWDISLSVTYILAYPGRSDLARQPVY